MLQEVTPRAQDSLVSFGERLSTRLFSALLRSQVRASGVVAACHWHKGRSLSQSRSSVSYTTATALPGAKLLR